MRAFTYKIQQKLIDKSDGNCYICGKPIDIENFQRYVTWKRKIKNGIKSVLGKVRRIKIDVNVDHIIPVSKGGTNDIINLALVHVKCNKTKGSKIYE